MVAGANPAILNPTSLLPRCVPEIGKGDPCLLDKRIVTLGHPAQDGRTMTNR
jgi:hypothetical protein